jgi:hypothetical protein
MNLTEWSPLFGVALGGLITMLVTWFANRTATEREDARWELARIRDQDARDHEQRLLTYEHRRHAYAEFIQTWRDSWNRIILIDPADTLTNKQSLLAPIWESLALVQIYGSQAAAEKASSAFQSMFDVVLVNQDPKSSPVATLDEFRIVVRRDLKVLD